jgi:protein involved in polysaccharide export with SLBB domain
MIDMKKPGVIAGAAMLMAALLTGCGGGADFTRLDSGPGAAVSGTPVSSLPPVRSADDQSLTGFKTFDAVEVTFLDTPMPIAPVKDRIKEDGSITLPFNQTFCVTNKTRAQIETEIHARYVPDYFKSLTVLFRHDEMTRFYYVGGEVRSPQRLPYVSRIKLSGAIKSAGDFTDFANRKSVQLTRADGKRIVVNCNEVQKDSTLDPEVYPGDDIRVPRKGVFGSGS